MDLPWLVPESRTIAPVGIRAASRRFAPGSGLADVPGRIIIAVYGQR